jgi:predicted esterase
MELFFLGSTRRYYELEPPRIRRPSGGWPVLVALHGYQGDKDSMMRIASRIAAGRMIAVSLQAPNQFFINYEDDPKNYRVGYGWGTTWKMAESVERHHSDLRRLLDLAVRKHQASDAKVFLLAFSQACSYNYRFIFTYPYAVRGAIAVCGGVPGDLGTNPLYHRASTAVLHIAATRDPWYSKEKNLAVREQLQKRVASLDFRFYNSPHRFPRRAIPYIRKWIQAHQ